MTQKKAYLKGVVSRVTETCLGTSEPERKKRHHIYLITSVTAWAEKCWTWLMYTATVKEIDTQEEMILTSIHLKKWEALEGFVWYKST